jgi:peptidase C39-like protein
MAARMAGWGRVLGVLMALATCTAPTIASADALRDNWYAPGAKRLVSVPVYRTQKDGSKYALSNCGPASLGMVLDAYGVDRSTLELRELTHTYQGTWPNRGGTALQHMAHVAEDFFVPVHGLYEAPGSDEFHKWTIDEVVNQVGHGRWVIPLVRYGMLPGHETSGVRTGHYIVVYRNDGDGFDYDDPAYSPIEEGQGRWISREQLDRAMDPVLVPRQAMALGD